MSNSDEDETSLSPEALAAVEHGNRVRAEIYQLRGEFLSDFAGIEGHLHIAIASYFMKPPPMDSDLDPEMPDSDKRHRFFALREEFDVWFLRAIGLAERITILARIIERIGLTDRLGSVVSGLRELKAFRDDIAHSTVGFPMSDILGTINRGLAGVPPQWYSIRRPRKTAGFLEQRADISELKAAIEHVRRINVRLLAVLVCISAARDGEDPVAALDSFEEWNPDS